MASSKSDIEFFISLEFEFVDLCDVLNFVLIDLSISGDICWPLHHVDSLDGTAGVLWPRRISIFRCVYQSVGKIV